MVRFKNAWKCKKCPQNNGESGCPMWWEVVMKNDATEATKIEKGCGFQILPQMMALVSTSTLHATAASYDMRNKVTKNVGKVVRAINEKLELDFTENDLVEMETHEDEVKFLENQGE